MKAALSVPAVMSTESGLVGLHRRVRGQFPWLKIVRSMEPRSPQPAARIHQLDVLGSIG